MKRVPDPRIAIDRRPLVFDRIESNFQKLLPDFLQVYTHAKEEIDPNFPQSFGPVMESTFFCDSDHAHDQATSSPLKGYIGYVGSTILIFMLCVLVQRRLLA